MKFMGESIKSRDLSPTPALPVVILAIPSCAELGRREEISKVVHTLLGTFSINAFSNLFIFLLILSDADR